ncbi:MAG: nucleoside kinase [Negativicutes bacterium]
MITRENHASYPPDRLLTDIRDEFQPGEKRLIVAAVLDGLETDLQTPVGTYDHFDWVYLDSVSGARIYRQSVVFLLVTAVKELYPEAEVIVRFTANKGLYCDINGFTVITPSIVSKIGERMNSIVAEDRPIIKKHLPREEAVALFKQSRQIAKANLIAAIPQETVSIYYCGIAYDYLYSAMLDTTGVLGEFILEPCDAGVLLRTVEHGVIPVRIEQPKFHQILTESKRWAAILHCDYLPDLNRYVRQGKSGEIVRVSEALHEKKIAEIADEIKKHIQERRIVLIAGPSSSGKTSFAQRLKVQLRVNGLEPVSISLDNYFVDRERTPLTPDGKYNYEALDALDLPLFNRHLLELLAGHEILLPRYDFITGKQELNASEPVSIDPVQPIILEGIHALNETLTAAVPREQKFKIYISALTQLNMDAHNRIHTTDARLLRRLVRDFKYRGAKALRTLRIWPIVRQGEETNIFPFQEDADAVFNSALIYELAVLKKHAIPLLADVEALEPEYTSAQELLTFLTYFDSIDEEDIIPNNSILREFIGSSCFFDRAGDLKT